MGGYGGHGPFRILRSLNKSAIFLSFKIKQSSRQYAVFGKSLPDSWRYRAQILSYDNSLLFDTLQGQNLQHVLSRVTDIGPLGRTGSLGNPKQTEEPHNVIHSQSSPTRTVLTQHLDKISIFLVSQSLGQQRGQAPILAQRAESIRWGADIDGYGK